VLTVGSNGSVRVQWKAAEQRWYEHYDLTSTDLAPPGAPVAVVYCPSHQEMNAFFVGNDGAAYVISKVNSGRWGTPFALTQPNFAEPGTGLAAVCQPLNQQREAFVANRDGTLYVLYRANDEPWQEPFKLSEPGLAAADGQIAAAYYPSFQTLEVFFVDQSGALNVIWKQNNGSWNEHFELTAAGFARAGAPLSVTYQPLNELLALFLFRADGSLQMVSKANNSQWSPAYEIMASGSAPVAAHIASAYWPVSDEIAVLFSDTDGALTVLEQPQQGHWTDPVRVTNPGVATPGGPVAMGYYPLGAQLEAVAATTSDDVKLIFKRQRSDWMGPYTLQ